MSRGLKKYFSLLLVISLFVTGALPASAGTENTAPVSWENLSPLPSGNKVMGVTIGANTVVVVGEGGSVGTFSNYATWAIRNSGVVNDLNDIINIGSGANAKFVAVGDKGTVITSTDGASWTTQTTGISENISENLNAVVYSGSRLVAVGDSGKIITSSDGGVTWAASTSGVSVNLNAIAYGDSKFVAVGDGGKIINSSDGLAWTPQTSGSTNDLNGISYGGNVFVAAGAAGEILSAPNALGTWTKGTNSIKSDFNSVSYRNNRFFIAGDAGKLIYSATGTSGWSSSVSVAGATDNLMKIKATDFGYFIVSSEGSVFFATASTGGTSSWEKFSSPTSSALKTVTYANNTYITVGTDGLIGTSTDGKVWSKVASGTTNAINGIAYGNSKFVTVGSNGQILTSSNNGTSWTAGTSVDAITLNSIVYGSGLFVAVGNSGKIVVSSDGFNWARISDSKTVNHLNAVTYGNGKYVAVGAGGTIVTSSNGAEWKSEDSKTNGKLLNGISYGSGLFVAVGASGTVVISADSSRWSARTIDGQVNLNGVASGSGVFMAAGDSGNVYYTADPSQTWHPETTGTTKKLNGIGFIAGQDRFIAVGDPGVMIVSYPVLNIPRVISQSPENAEKDIPTDAELVLTFNQKVTAASGNINIYKASDLSAPVETIPVDDSIRVTVQNNTVTVNPEKDLDKGTKYAVTIDSDTFYNESEIGNVAIEGDAWSFTTVAVLDETAPIVTAYSPDKGETGVAIDADLTLTFSEDVTKESGNIEIYESTDSDVPVQIIPISSNNVAIDGSVITIDPFFPLKYNTSYFVNIGAGSFIDPAGNYYAGITDSGTWQFTTEEAPDTTPPVVSSYSPEDRATEVATGANLTLTFSENVTKGEGSIEIYNSANSITPAVTIPVTSEIVTVQGNVVTINPEDKLDYSTSYFVKIGSGAFKDTAGNNYAGITNSTTWRFTTTGEPDTAAPTVSAYLPANGATGVGVETNLVLTFSENVSAGEGSIVIYNSASDKAVATISASDLTILNDVVTVNPADNLEYGTSYFVQITDDAFTDTAGNYFAGISDSTTWQFTTAAAPDTTSPTVTAFSPEPGATEVGIDANLILTFSENVKKAEGSIEIFKSTDEIHPIVTIPVASDIVTIQNNVVTINPADNLEHGTSYFVRITEGAFRDNAGNSFAGIAGITAWRFVTASGPDTAAPLVTAYSPADNATQVSTSAALSLTFNENVLAGDANIDIVNAADDMIVTTIKAGNQALVSVTNATVSINTGGILKQGGSYYVLIHPGAFTDESGNSFAGIADKTVWNFSTVPVPVTPTDPPASGSGGSGGAAPVATPSTQTETINLNVENGSTQGSNVSSVVVSRTKDANGVKSDVITFALDQALRAINELKAAGSNIARIIVPDANDEVAETRMTIPAASSKAFADNQISLDIFTVNAEVKVPGSSLVGFGTDIYFNLVPLKTQQQSADAEARAKAQVQSLSVGGAVTLVGRPVTIDTNLQSRPVTLVLPINNTSLTAEQLKALAVFIEHSDGTKELVKGEIVPFGQTGKSGIQFNVNKFSTFTVVLAQDPAVQVKAYMTGYADGTFQPGKSITRAEVASIIARTFNPSASTSGVAYTDLAAGHWATNAINLVSSSGIMKGYADGSFKPNQTITRAEMATILSRLVTNGQGNAVSFSDIAGHWAQAAVETTAKAGMITGYEDGTFRPNQTLTRAEAVTIVNRALGITPLTSAAPQWSDVPAQYWAFSNIQAASVDHTAE
ncbi:Ig-like domain-containing protein [Paenibacillus phytohabitans]|uniref:Ig-like domain-containing protein n=1 Tax=Paenibacillus phytohabitans TaxID=2654978 RepID=UPI003009ACD5